MRPPPRRSAGGTIAGIFGGLTSLVVLAILGISLFGGSQGAAAGPGRPPPRPAAPRRRGRRRPTARSTRRAR
ncbi:hypothetical protein ACFQY7_46415 [Actinomadura luteofluorescens]|uniref:hypothetical protein n=1 Tax=Actinomadura luteofluorescens TaxID=46163 RepID=UPI0036262EB2